MKTKLNPIVLVILMSVLFSKITYAQQWSDHHTTTNAFTAVLKPNPSNKVHGVTLEVFCIAKNEDVHITVYDVFGAIMLNRNFTEFHDINHFEIGFNSKNFKPGYYTVQIIKGAHTQTKLFVISG